VALSVFEEPKDYWREDRSN